MSAEQKIGDLVAQVVARSFACRELQVRLNAMSDASEQKRAIMRARHAGAIDDEQAELLIQAYQLETA